MTCDQAWHSKICWSHYQHLSFSLLNNCQVAETSLAHCAPEEIFDQCKLDERIYLKTSEDIYLFVYFLESNFALHPGAAAPPCPPLFRYWFWNQGVRYIQAHSLFYVSKIDFYIDWPEAAYGFLAWFEAAYLPYYWRILIVYGTVCFNQKCGFNFNALFLVWILSY